MGRWACLWPTLHVLVPPVVSTKASALKSDAHLLQSPILAPASRPAQHALLQFRPIFSAAFSTRALTRRQKMQERPIKRLQATAARKLHRRRTKLAPIPRSFDIRFLRIACSLTSLQKHPRHASERTYHTADILLSRRQSV